MKSKRYNSSKDLAKNLGLTPERGQLAELKAKMTKELIKTVKKNDYTHQEIADLSGVPRSAITGIINGSLQKVTIDRLFRILASLGKSIDFKLRDAA